MARHIHIDPFNGVAGDMLLAALIHAGAPIEPIRAALNGAALPEGTRIEIEAEPLVQHETAGLRLHISAVSETAFAPLRFPELRSALAGAPLPPGARKRALAALDAVGRAEATARGTELSQVTLCGLGGLDSLIDFGGVALALELLEIDTVTCSPLPLTTGPIQAALLTLPGPASATLELLRDLPTAGVSTAAELVTPTGAALVRTLATSFGPPPSMTFRRAGTGFGTREFPDRPNCLRVMVGEVESAHCDLEPLQVLETNLDDLSAEVLATLIDACLIAGALDAWLTPALMKKGRPAHLLSALCTPATAQAVEETILRHSSSLGVRRSAAERRGLVRSWEEVSTPWGPVRVKLGHLGNEVVNRAPEYEDCRRLAEAAGVPLKEVYAAALGAAFCR